MDRFVSTFTNKLDAKGRVSIPAPFREVLARDGYSGGQPQGPAGGGIYCYPALDTPALDAGGESLASKIDALLTGLSDYSDERDQLSVALYGDVHILKIDGDGRIILPEELKRHAKLESEVTFVGLGQKFQIWQPAAFEAYRADARGRARDHRQLFAGRRSGGDEPSGG